MRTLSIGKLRGLQKISSDNHVFSILALDHRQNLRKSFNASHPESVSDDMLVRLKNDIIANITEGLTAILLDPEVGAAQVISAGTLSGKVGLTVALETTGYEGNSTERESRILEGWGVKKAKITGADAVKLLVYYNPDNKSALIIQNLINDISKECEIWQIPLMLEVLTYSQHPGNQQLTSKEKQEIIKRSVRDLSHFNIDIIKIEFPTDRDASLKDWENACNSISKICTVPWILLSAAVDFNTYLKQVEVACAGGASGIAAGRAIWQEAINLEHQQRIDFLKTTAQDRMRLLSKICIEKAKPWCEHFQSPLVIVDWFKNI